MLPEGPPRGLEQLPFANTAGMLVCTSGKIQIANNLLLRLQAFANRSEVPAPQTRPLNEMKKIMKVDWQTVPQMMVILLSHW